MSEARYSSVAVALHWAIAVLILGQIAGGFYMHNLPNASPIKFDLYQLHKSFGLSILLLTVFRLGWRFTHRPPALPAAMPGWEKLAARAAHWGFYALLILTPLAGWAMVSVSPTEIPTKFFGFIPVPHLPFFDGVADAKAAEDMMKERHELLAILILVLLALHVGAALKHRFWNKDQVLQSMTPSRVGQWAGVAGILATLGVGAVLYGFSPPLVTGSQTAPLSENSGTANWVVNYDASALTFIGEEKGRRFTGRFPEFQADILFFEDDLAASSVTVTVATAATTTGDELRDTNLPNREWFDTNNHPTARFSTTAIRRAGAGSYEADGILAIKDFEKAVTLSFTLEVDGDEAVAKGGADLIRTDFGLGSDESWLEEEQLQPGVRVEFEIYATQRR